MIGCSWYYSWPGDILGDSREEAVTYGGASGIFEVQTNLDVKITRYVTPLADRGYRGAVSRVGSGYSTNWIPEKSNQARDDAMAPPF